MAIRVYRYFRSDYALLALQTKEWKIGRLNQLNDPYDCFPLITGRPTTILQGPFGIGFLTEMGQQMGVICYSRAIDNPAIWSHYADCHRGIALGFDYNEGDGLFKVAYPENNKRAVITFDEMLAGEQQGRERLTNIIAKGFTVKASSWAYEQEYRHFIFFDGCEMKGAHYFRTLPCLKLKVVVLGANCTIPKSDILHILTKNSSGTDYYEGVRTLKATLDDDAYRMNTN